MPAKRLYYALFKQIAQLRPGERITRLRNMTWLLVGIYLSRSVHLSRIALKIPGTAKLVSIIRRLSRFLDNPAIRVREWFEPIARGVLQAAAQTVGEIRLIADGTKVSFGHQLLMVSRGRYPYLPLLAYVRQLIPSGIPVLLVGDSEFGAADVIRQVEAWGWRYVLRQKGGHLIQLRGGNWKHFEEVIQKPGQSLWLGEGLLTREHAHPTSLLAHWEKGNKEPWLLATNLSSRQETLHAYRRRMWVEEMFGDLKSNGFDLESTHLIHFLRLSRLTLAVVLLYVWLIATGSRAIKNGQRHLVDRAERRDLSIFQIGLRLVERCLTNAWPVSAKFYQLSAENCQVARCEILCADGVGQHGDAEEAT